MRIPRKYIDLLFSTLDKSRLTPEDLIMKNSNNRIQFNFEYSDFKTHFFFTRSHDNVYTIAYLDVLSETEFKKNLKLWNRVTEKMRNESIIKELPLRFTDWLESIYEEFKTPNKFDEYFANIGKFDGILIESDGAETASEEQVLLFNDQLDKLKKYIDEKLDSKTILIQQGQEVLFNELEELKIQSNKKETPLRILYNAALGSLFSWGINYAIPIDIIKNALKDFVPNIQKSLGIG